MLDSTISAKDTAELAYITRTAAGSITKERYCAANRAGQDEFPAVERTIAGNHRKPIA
jgi:hypothetical protein